MESSETLIHMSHDDKIEHLEARELLRDPHLQGLNRNEHAVLRLNGNHGTHKNRLGKTSVKGPHIHLMTERYQERTTHPDGFAVETDEYTDLEDNNGLYEND